MRRLELVSRDLHRIVLGEASIDYVLARRRGRRGIGLKVDAEGCAKEYQELQSQLVETGMMRLENVNFELNKATLLPESVTVPTAANVRL